jgi:acetyl-CoA carboxylase biotin carboxyl carrier protein
MLFKDVDLKKLLKMMHDHDVTEVTLKDGKTVIEVKKNKEVIVNPVNTLSRPHENAAGLNLIKPEAGIIDKIPEKEEAESSPIKENREKNCHIVEAPLVGTFYRSPSPEDDFFVDVGDSVESGDVLCIVEAMKSMNEIQADVDGVIKEICVNNSDLVEFEQPLFKIEKKG